MPDGQPSSVDFLDVIYGREGKRIERKLSASSVIQISGVQMERMVVSTLMYLWWKSS